METRDFFHYGTLYRQVSCVESDLTMQMKSTEVITAQPGQARSAWVSIHKWLQIGVVLINHVWGNDLLNDFLAIVDGY